MKHLTRAHQRYARSRVSSESCAANGRKGAAATIRKHGFPVFFEGWRRWRNANPSKPELLLIGILSSLGIASLRNWQIADSFLTLDFYLPETGQGIEVHGRIHSTLKQQERAANDARKRELLAVQGIDTLWIGEDELRDVAELIQAIKRFLA